MDRVALDLGFIQIYWYSICLFVGMLAASFVIYREAKRRGIDDDTLINLTFSTILFGIIGARLYYVIFNFPYYSKHPLEILEIWNGGLAIHGGLLFGLISIISNCKKKRISVMRMLDIIVVGLILGQAIGRWGNFFNSEAYGAITTLETLQSQGIPKFIIDGMYIMGEYRQPTFFYESIGCLFGFLAMIIIRLGKYLKRGNLTAFYLVWYGVLRFLVEGLRTDSLMLGSLKMAQIVSLSFVLIGIIIFLINLKKSKGDENLYRKDPNKVMMEQMVYYN
ncbi:MAG: prolipoprotein diacylglyceryl transferase [Bacilli bacterium]|nr:prolipoprotein diacylglyceryl transferase [Bacilli bacterium]